MRLVRVMRIVLIALALLASAIPVAAEPLAQGCEGLVNPGFEEGFSQRGANEVSVANGWFPWWQDGPFAEDGYNRRPEYKPEERHVHGDRRIHSGGYAQKYFTTYSTHTAGIYQKVGGIPVGTKCTFQIWVQVWSSQHHDPGSVDEPGNYRVSVGIDPTGGTDWASPNVVWSEPQMQYNTWMQLSVTAVAKANAITVYTRGRPEYRTRFNDSYWDDACLTLVRPAPTSTPTPRPTNTPTVTDTPTDTPTPENTATPTHTPTPVRAYVCVQVHDDPNGNAETDAGEGLLAGALIKLLDEQGKEVDSYTTDDSSEPHCFTTREEGSYQVTERDPAGYMSTSADNWAVYAVPGTTVDVHFWDKMAPTSTPTNTNTPLPTDTPVPTDTSSPTPIPVTPTATVNIMAAASSSSTNESSFGGLAWIVVVLGLALIIVPRLIRRNS